VAVSLTTSNYNLLDPSSWTAGSGSVGIFSANGDTGEQNRYIGTDPWGNAAMVWQTVPSGNNQADGGWNTSGVSIDSSKLYRFSVWVKRTSATGGGTFYFGLQSSSGSTVGLDNDVVNTNPYFDYRGTSALTQNQWYLFVGHCYPATYYSRLPHDDSGYYTTSGRVGWNAGNVPNDCRWVAGTTTAVHRTYHYYCAEATTHLEFFYPRIDCIDGTHPSMQRLLSNPSDSERITFPDSTSQSTNFDSAKDAGKLMSTTTFTSSGTWIKPPACTRIIVKVVGGGGGASGYCESGGAGGYSEKVIDVAQISTVAVTVGGGGGAVGYYAAGGNGGTSSFGSYCSATGGYGANQHAGHTGGHGGVGSSGDVNFLGGTGTGHGNTGGREAVGTGGAGYWGGGKRASHSTNADVGYSAPGAGGCGGAMQGWVGSAGASGLVVVYEYR
jgi:hypothetical protein